LTKNLLNPEQGDDQLPALLLVLLVILVLFVLGFAVVKFLICVAIVLALIWLIGFFVRGVEGARWYRW
jgi:energy-coupling factor transporter transmembrane protein EcfT